MHAEKSAGAQSSYTCLSLKLKNPGVVWRICLISYRWYQLQLCFHHFVSSEGTFQSFSNGFSRMKERKEYIFLFEWKWSNNNRVPGVSFYFFLISGFSSLVKISSDRETTASCWSWEGAVAERIHWTVEFTRVEFAILQEMKNRIGVQDKLDRLFSPWKRY